MPRFKDSIANIMAAILVVCAITLTTLWIRREIIGPPEDIRLKRIPNWKDFDVGGHQFAVGNGPVSIIVFSDFQCTFCAILAKRLDSLSMRMPGRISIRFRHFPVPGLHNQATDAALAAECAGDQGRFRQYHDVLFQEQISIGRTSWSDFAVKAGISDITRFSACVADSTALPTVIRDVEAGQELHVLGTPSILVNELFHRGAPTLSTLEDLVNRARRHSSVGGQRQSETHWTCDYLRPNGRGRSDPELPEKFERTILEHLNRNEVCVGMTSEMIRIAWGSPLTIVKRSRYGEERADWDYGSKMVIVVNDTVASFR